MSANGVPNTDERHGDQAIQYSDHPNNYILAETQCEYDKYNLGKILLEKLALNPHKLNQIDAADDAKETNGELRARVLACSRAVHARGLRRGDVMAVIGRNHLDVCVPPFAGLVSGVATIPIDPNLESYELRKLLDIGKPRLVFCDSNKTATVRGVLQDLSPSTTIVAFPYGHVKNLEGVQGFDEFLSRHAHEEHSFTVPSFNTEDTLAVLMCTSGTTGTPKLVKLTHHNFCGFWLDHNPFPEAAHMIMNISSINWLTSILNLVLSVVHEVTRVQTSAKMTPEHLLNVINKYKPACMVCSPSLMQTLLTHPDTDDCGFSCFQSLYYGGSSPGKDLMMNIQKRMPHCRAINSHGLTETTGILIEDGKPFSALNYKIVDNNGDEILSCNKPGELLVKGGLVFKGYYNDEAATKEAMTADGYLRTGDIFYRDEGNRYIFVDRLKMLIKYRNFQISPQQTEEVIMRHPGVSQVAVCGIPHEADGEHPAACVVRSTRHPPVTAQEIKDIVKNTLSPNNQLRGGVMFLDQLPLTSTGKVNRSMIKRIALEAQRE